VCIDTQDYVDVLGLDYEILFFGEVHLLCLFIVLYKSHQYVTSLGHYVACTVNVFELSRRNIHCESHTIVAEIIYTTRLNPNAIVHESRLRLFGGKISRPIFLSILYS